MNKERSKASVSTYLILEKDGMVLLGLRKNTGYQDGMYCLVSGHVEDNEAATTAMCREAKEEIGIDINPHDLKIVLIMHRKSTGCRAPCKTFWDVRVNQNVRGGATIILMPRTSPSESYNFV